MIVELNEPLLVLGELVARGRLVQLALQSRNFSILFANLEPESSQFARHRLVLFAHSAAAVGLACGDRLAQFLYFVFQLFQLILSTTTITKFTLYR